MAEQLPKTDPTKERTIKTRTTIAATNELSEVDRRARKRRRARKWKAWLMRMVGSVQRADGSWTWPDLATSPAISALIILAIISLVGAVIAMWNNRL